MGHRRLRFAPMFFGIMTAAHLLARSPLPIRSKRRATAARRNQSSRRSPSCRQPRSCSAITASPTIGAVAEVRSRPIWHIPAGWFPRGDLFVGNSATGDGGAVAVSGGALQMSHALFKADRAGGRGAALSVGSRGSASISNTLVVKNAGPNGAIAGNAVTLTNVTVADNQAVGLLLSTEAHSGKYFARTQCPRRLCGCPSWCFPRWRPSVRRHMPWPSCRRSVS